MSSENNAGMSKNENRTVMKLSSRSEQSKELESIDTKQNISWKGVNSGSVRHFASWVSFSAL